MIEYARAPGRPRYVQGCEIRRVGWDYRGRAIPEYRYRCVRHGVEWSGDASRPCWDRPRGVHSIRITLSADGAKCT